MKGIRPYPFPVLPGGLLKGRRNVILISEIRPGFLHRAGPGRIWVKKAGNHMSEIITYPFIVFKLKGGLYAIDSRYIATMIEKPPARQEADVTGFIAGTMRYQNDVIQLADLRRFLGIPAIRQEKDEFSQMIEARKQDHVRWVKALEHSLESGLPFELATDPHKCAFGHWYYGYKTDRESVNYILRQIEEPHAILHSSAIEALADKQGAALGHIRNEYMPQVMELLDKIKQVVADELFREMVLVLNEETGWGLIVDEILSVSDLGPAQTFTTNYKGDQNYISGVITKPGTNELILVLDIPELLKSFAQKAQAV